MDIFFRLYLQTKVIERKSRVMQSEIKISGLELQAAKIRRKVVDLVYLAKSGHIGGSLSSVNIETVLYFHVMNNSVQNQSNQNRDRFILSKGHCVETLYCVLNAAGYIDDSVLATYGKFNSVLAGHPTKKVPGVELNSGALGHGLSVGVGIAIGAKMSKLKFRTYVLMGDGEQGEGSIYEAAMSASHYKLDNIVAIIDRNKLQISGRTEDVMNLESMYERWVAFGWDVLEVNGDSVADLVHTFDTINYTNSKPKLIIAHTTKGAGVSYMENVAKWHHGVPDIMQYEIAVKEISDKINTLVDVQ